MRGSRPLKSRPPRYTPRRPVPESIGRPTVTTVTVTPQQAADHILELLRWANREDDAKGAEW